MNSQEIFQPYYVALPSGVGENFSMTKPPKIIVRRAKTLRPKVKQQNFLKEWREYRNNITQEALAEAAGMTAGNVSQFEQGVQGHSKSGLAALARVLKCEPGDILSVNPLEDGDMWSTWKRANPAERRMISEIARTIVGKTRAED